MLTEMFTKDCGSTIWPMAMVSIRILMVPNTKEIGIMTSNMEMERRVGLMAHLMMANMLMA